MAPKQACLAGFAKGCDKPRAASFYDIMAKVPDLPALLIPPPCGFVSYSPWNEVVGTDDHDDIHEFSGYQGQSSI